MPAEQGPDYETAWRALSEPLSWMQTSKALTGYWGWGLAEIANDLIRRAYPDLAESIPANEARSAALGEKMRPKPGTARSIEFDITKGMTVENDAGLALLVLGNFADLDKPFSPGDARRVMQAIDRLVALLPSETEKTGG